MGDEIPGITTLIKCADLQVNDRVLIVSDPSTFALGSLIAKQASLIAERVAHKVTDHIATHGTEPPDDVAKAMLESDVVFGITKMSMVHTDARQCASSNGCRYLSLPDYSFELLKRRALAMDFRSLTEFSQRLARLFTEADEITLATKTGSHLVMQVRGRIANPAPGWCFRPGAIASPPDAEVNIAPIEAETSGELIVDGSIPCPDIGLLRQPITLRIKNGKVYEVVGECATVLNRLFDRVGTDKARIIGEFGVGLNSMAELSGYMLEDEGCLGTVHLGIGSNSTIGGCNAVAFHLDHVVRGATIFVDGKELMTNGVFSTSFTFFPGQFEEKQHG